MAGDVHKQEICGLHYIVQCTVYNARWRGNADNTNLATILEILNTFKYHWHLRC